MTTNNEHKNIKVPNLRFPEFQGEWEELGLSEFLDFKNGLNPKPDKFGKGIKGSPVKVCGLGIDLH